MPSVSAIFLLVIYVCQSLVGTATSAFIVAVNLVSWAKGIALTPNDQILLSLGLSSLCVQATSATGVFSFLCFGELLFTGFCMLAFWLFFLFGNHSNFWLTASLFGYYNLKVMNTQQPFLLWMKTKCMKYTFQLLCFSLVLSFGFSLLAVYQVFRNTFPETSANLTSNYSNSFSRPYNNFPGKQFFSLMDTTWPLVVTSFHFIHLLKGIWKHIQKMKRTMTGSGVPNLSAHRNASHTLTCLLILYVLYYVAWCAINFEILPLSSNGFLMCMAAFSILSSAQAVTFIARNPKLKKQALGILQNFRPPAAKAQGRPTGDISCVTSPL